MADVREESRLGAVELGQGLDPAPLLLVGVGVGDGGGDLAGHQPEETAIVLVEQAIGIQSHDQHAAAAGLAGGRDGQHRRRRP